MKKLLGHCRVAHGHRSVVDMLVVTNQCPFCMSVFANKKTAVKHVKNLMQTKICRVDGSDVHYSKQPQQDVNLSDEDMCYDCLYCGEELPSLTAFQHHVRQHFPLKPEEFSLEFTLPNGRQLESQTQTGQTLQTFSSRGNSSKSPICRNTNSQPINQHQGGEESVISRGDTGSIEPSSQAGPQSWPSHQRGAGGDLSDIHVANGLSSSSGSTSHRESLLRETERIPHTGQSTTHTQVPQLHGDSNGNGDIKSSPRDSAAGHRDLHTDGNLTRRSSSIMSSLQNQGLITKGKGKGTEPNSISKSDDCHEPSQDHQWWQPLRGGSQKPHDNHGGGSEARFSSSCPPREAGAANPKQDGRAKLGGQLASHPPSEARVSTGERQRITRGAVITRAAASEPDVFIAMQRGLRWNRRNRDSTSADNGDRDDTDRGTGSNEAPAQQSSASSSHDAPQLPIAAENPQQQEQNIMLHNGVGWIPLADSGMVLHRQEDESSEEEWEPRIQMFWLVVIQQLRPDVRRLVYSLFTLSNLRDLSDDDLLSESFANYVQTNLLSERGFAESFLVHMDLAYPDYDLSLIHI